MDFRIASLIAVLTIAVKGQQQSAPLWPPFGPANQIASPDGAYALFGGDKEAELWLEDTRSHRRKSVVKITVQTLSIAWSPDSTAFAVNDRAVSDLETAYIYNVKTLERLDLRRSILAADPEARSFVPSGNAAPHSYFHVLRWLDAKHVEVQLHGHTDGIRIGSTVRPGDCFDLRYRVDRASVVQKLSRVVSPITGQKGCDGVE